ncbi:MAG: nucleotidyltransferase domain-containing protein [Candidatus Dormibacteraeota bacterium]|nr:nucleotidyltransferase domain-containing protein [Candidatus Dormibacteraeota bacterium]
MPSIQPNLPSGIVAFTRKLGGMPCVTEVILFGSRARGDNRPDSDTDLLVLLDNATKDDRRQLNVMQEEFNRTNGVPVQLLGIVDSQVRRELRAGYLPLYDAMIEGTSLYPDMGKPPRHRSEASLFSMDGAAAQWLAVAEDSMASAEQGHETLPASHPLARFLHGYMPARVHRLAVAAVRSAMWTAYYLRGVRPDRAAALDALANDLGWPTDSLRQLLAPVASEDEADARRATAIAVRYMELVRKLAANKGVRPKRISHDAIEAYRSILEKHESRLERI